MQKLIILLNILVISSCNISKNIDAQNTITQLNKIEQTEQSIQKTTELQTETTELQTETTTIETTELQIETLPLDGKIICIDPGHGIYTKNRKEPLAPNSNEMKNAFNSGTHGANQTEEQLNLKVGLKLNDKLKDLGATVIMTRTDSNCDISNAERAEIANANNSDLFLRIHADGVDNQNVSGMSMLVPTSDYIDKDIADKSNEIGEIVLKSTIDTTGAKNRGISKRGDMVGFNWSKVPVILIEMGFMTNQAEDFLLETEDYQNKIVDGICNGLLEYFK